MINIAGKGCEENPNTYLIFNKHFFFENSVVYDITWKNAVQPDRPQMTIWSVSIASWMPKATNTHSEFVIPIALHCNNG